MERIMLNDELISLNDGILEYDGREVENLCSPIDPEFKKIFNKYNFERLIVKTKYLTKQYDENFNLISVEPFFVDVTLYNPHKNFSVVASYTKTNSIIRVLNVSTIIEYYYEITIDEYFLPIKILIELYQESLIYEQTGKTKDLIIRRWYKEFGILEYLMKDDSILEININPPGYKTPIRIVHEQYGECVTNIYPSQSFIDYFVTRLKMHSGRPLNKVSPELDTEIVIAGINVRIAVVSNPFSIFGPGFSIRKHRETPWTFELFIANKTIESTFAGFMGLIIAHGRSYIMAGPRGSGKTSLMTSSLIEIPTTNRIITIEDTQEIPIKSLKKLGFDLLSLKVRSALMDEGIEIDFEKGLRTTLRLGDSCLILGEIRGKEAKVLYEAMRVGAASNVVTGTIHADTAYGVYDRVVNDLGVKKGSFKVTDFIILINLIKDSTGARKVRRIMEVVEVTKDWEDEPVFQTLFKYDPKQDKLVPTDILTGGKSTILKELIANTSSYNDITDILGDIEIRAKIKEIVLKNVGKNKKFLEAEHTKAMNTIFLKHYLSFSSFKDEKKKEELYATYDREVKDYIKRNK